MKWISVKERLPPTGVEIKIKAEYPGEPSFEGIAILKVYDIDETTEALGWTIKEGYKCTLKPSHWMPLLSRDSLERPEKI